MRELSLVLKNYDHCWHDTSGQDRFVASGFTSVVFTYSRRSLRAVLSTLRKELGERVLITDRATVQLNPNSQYGSTYKSWNNKPRY